MPDMQSPVVWHLCQPLSLQHGSRALRKLLGFEFCEGNTPKVTVSELDALYYALRSWRAEYGD